MTINQLLAFLKKKDLYLGIARYLLGLGMITYALSKLLRTQFVVLPFALWQRPLESIPGRNLAWAFLGYSAWFQVLLGFLELVPALLLLFRRTSFAGGILMLPLTLNIYLINMALDLWSGTKTISLLLLILNCLVLIFEWKRAAIIVAIIINKLKLRFTIVEVMINLVLVAGISYMALNKLLDYKAQRNILTGDWLNHHPYEWKLVSETLGPDTLEPRDLKVYYGAYGSYTELSDTTFTTKLISYDLNEKSGQLNLTPVKGSKIICTYKFTKDSLLQIDRTMDTAGHAQFRQLFKRRIINAR